jgi:hypothetical protein
MKKRPGAPASPVEKGNSRALGNPRRRDRPPTGRESWYFCQASRICSADCPLWTACSNAWNAWGSPGKSVSATAGTGSTAGAGTGVGAGRRDNDHVGAGRLRIRFLDQGELELHGDPRGDLEGDIGVGKGATVPSSLRLDTDGPRAFDPLVL